MPRNRSEGRTQLPSDNGSEDSAQPLPDNRPEGRTQPPPDNRPEGRARSSPEDQPEPRLHGPPDRAEEFLPNAAFPACRGRADKTAADMSNRETGALGERAAAEALRAAGYELQALNWRQGRYELDIVASRDGVLHFVEVKTRQADSLTPPEAAATHRKFHALRRAASVYLATTGWQGEVQFDLAAVTVATDGATDVRLIENAMECHW